MTITETEQSSKFFNHDEGVGGGGAIDLTMHLGGFSFSQALAYLGNIAGHVATINQYQAEGPKHAKRILDKTPVPKHEIPVADGSKLNRVRAYLTETRAIPESIVEKSIAKGRLWADKFGNCVFVLSDPTLSGKMVGVELRGTYEKPFHGVRGEQKGMFFTGTAKASVAVFVESAIEGLSYEAMNPNTLVISTTGSSVENLVQAATLLKERGYELVAGFNNDKDGDRAAKRFMDKVEGVRREKPEMVKDWNLLLQKQREEQRGKESAAAERNQLVNKSRSEPEQAR